MLRDHRGEELSSGKIFDSGKGYGKLSPQAEMQLKLLRQAQEAKSHYRNVLDEYGYDAIEASNDDITNHLAGYADRRMIEEALRQKIIECNTFGDRWLTKVAKSMEWCRCSGLVGIRPFADVEEQRLQIAWSHKCGHVRFCPDEAREDGERVVTRYHEVIREFKAGHKKRLLQYAVFTLHNFAPGELHRGKRYIIQQFREKILKQYPQIKGCLITVEDPLSQNGDWNVHLNAVLLIDGHFDWSRVRKSWGFNVHFEVIKEGMRKGKYKTIKDAIRELVKYCAKMVTVDGSKAPGLLDYPTPLFLEWARAQKSFRRTRAYGCLYKIHARRWERLQNMPARHLLDLLSIAREYDTSMTDDLMFLPWNDLTERQKTVIRKAMDEGRPCFEGVKWIRTVWFDPVLQIFDIDSIRRDNSQGNYFPAGVDQNDNFSTGPPSGGSSFH